MIIGIPLTHRRLLKGEAWVWLRRDIVPPMLTVLAVVSVGRWLVISSASAAASVLAIAAVLFCALLAAALAAPEMNFWLRTKLKEMKVIM
jgi:hypothetical protein